jgi:hypothetical protein
LENIKFLIDGGRIVSPVVMVAQMTVVAESVLPPRPVRMISPVASRRGLSARWGVRRSGSHLRLGSATWVRAIEKLHAQIQWRSHLRPDCIDAPDAERNASETGELNLLVAFIEASRCRKCASYLTRIARRVSIFVLACRVYIGSEGGRAVTSAISSR